MNILRQGSTRWPRLAFIGIAVASLTLTACDQDPAWAQKAREQQRQAEVQLQAKLDAMNCEEALNYVFLTSYRSNDNVDVDKKMRQFLRDKCRQP